MKVTTYFAVTSVVLLSLLISAEALDTASSLRRVGRSHRRQQVRAPIVPVSGAEAHEGTGWNAAKCTTAFKASYIVGAEIARGGEGVIYALTPAAGKTFPTTWSHEVVLKAVTITDQNKDATKQEADIGTEITTHLHDAAWMKMYDHFTCVDHADLGGDGAGKTLTTKYFVLEKVAGKEINKICFETTDHTKVNAWNLADLNKIFDDVKRAIDEGWTGLQLVHNDLQGRNVLIQTNTGTHHVEHVKIIDYGNSHSRTHKGVRTQGVCSKHYDMAKFASVLTQCIKGANLPRLSNEVGWKAFQDKLYEALDISRMLADANTPSLASELAAVKKATGTSAAYTALKTAVRVNQSKGLFKFPSMSKDKCNFLTVIVDNDSKSAAKATGVPILQNYVGKPKFRKFNAQNPHDQDCTY